MPTGCPAEDSEVLIAALRAKFPRSKLVFTMGAAGSVYSDEQTTLRQGIYKTSVVDTTVAGDTFTGYFIAGIIAGDNPAASLKRATMASSICVGREGTAPSIPALNEVRAALAAF